MKGRNKNLIEERDQKLYERFYCLVEVKRLRFDDAVKYLAENEFFLSEARVIQLLRKKIQEGATVNGERFKFPLFMGFRDMKRTRINNNKN